jgi:hypothetical protein
LRRLAMMALVVVSAVGWGSAASGQSLYLEAVPTAWRLQDYLDGYVTLFYTPSTACANGLLKLSGTEESRNRLWALIMTAKATNKVVGIFYDSSTCLISSFYEKEG